MNQTKTPRFNLIKKYFSLLENRKPSDKFFLQASLLAFIIASVYFVYILNERYTVSIPTRGGVLVEGIVGTPRFVNPVLATTRADKDIVELVYSGLLKINSEGDLVPDLAESVELLENGQTYHVKLKDNIYFHDGSKVTARDVAYTIALIQNPDLKSPLRGNWEGVLVEELGEKELNIVVSKPYTPFIENLKVGIIPREIWDNLPTEQLPFSQNNTNPVGSGPYQITNTTYNQSGLITHYTLKASDSHRNLTNIEKLELYFYTTEEELLTALNAGKIMSTASLGAENFSSINMDKFAISNHELPRTFSIYFNQNKLPALRSQAVREALQIMIDKQDLVDKVLLGNGMVTNSPIPAGYEKQSLDTENQEAEQDFDPLTKASSILTNDGWTKNESGNWIKKTDDSEMELAIEISTANSPFFNDTAEYIAQSWRDLGVIVNVAQFKQTDLVQAIIRPRSFQALLFGAEQDRIIDLYPFWHSSQKNDPGLNIAGYTSIEVDALLEKARKATSSDARFELNQEAIKLIKTDSPAIFLFTPTFSYVHDKNLLLSIPPRLSNHSDRFSDIGSWSVSTENIWPVFKRD